MMKAVDLEPRRVLAEGASEFALPKCDPWFDLQHHVCWRTEEMNVIGHDHVRTDHPAIGLAPDFQQSLMHDEIRKVLFALSRTDGDENNRGLAKKDEDTFGWMTALFERPDNPLRLDSV